MTQALDSVHRAPTVVDISALQSAESRGRGIARYALSWCIALEHERPDLVGAYCLNDQLPPPGSLGELISSGKVTYASPGLIANARIFHQLAPFDLSQPATTLLPERGPSQLTSATVYDLIPARDLNSELVDPISRRRYRTRLEVVRSLDHLQVLSDAVASDLVTLLGIDNATVTCVGAAPHETFVPPVNRGQATTTALATFSDRGLTKPYVLYPSGSHPRKNNERLIKAWARVRPDVRERHQFVLSGSFDAPTINHFHHLASTLGIDDQIIVAGYLEDKQLVDLVQGAGLVCFGSLAEGYGLPIVEAIACETPVIASAVAPHDELLKSDALFDPYDEGAIATAITNALEHPSVTSRSALQRWPDVGRASGAAFDDLLATQSSRRLRRPLQRRRPRVAVVSPLPPSPSGIARYSYRMIEAMAATEKVELTCFSDGPTLNQVAPPELPVHRVESLRHVEFLEGHFDDVVYVLGNSHHHLGALKMLKARRGVVLSHEVRLANLYRHANGDPGLLPGGLGRDVQRIYRGQLPTDLGKNGELRDEDLEHYGLYMAREVIAASMAFLVTSTSAAELARVDAGASFQRRIGTLPFAMEAPGTRELGFEDEKRARPDSLRGDLARIWGTGPPTENDRWVAHFGIVDPAKSPDVLMDAFAPLGSHTDARLVFVGPIADAHIAQLTEQADQLGIVDRVGFTGPISAADYRAWLDRATLAVQLRNTTNGEASAAVGECLSCGVPTLVSNIGWTGELPDSAVHHVASRSTPEQLSIEIASLLNDASLRRSLGENARIYAQRYSFDYSARLLLQLLDTRRAVRSRRSA